MDVTNPWQVHEICIFHFTQNDSLTNEDESYQTIY